MSERPYQPAPELQQVLDDVERIGNPLDQLTPQSVPVLWIQREMFARAIIAPIPIQSLRDTFVPARNRLIPIRIYTPADRRLERNGKLPVLLYLHGGGWTLGSIATYDNITRFLANNIPAIVISVDYRLAPEHPFPAALEDAHLALEWTARNAEELGGDPQRLAIAGDSAGATLATVLSLRAQNTYLPIRLQALFYPSVHIASTDYPSYAQYGEKHWLTRKAVESFRSLYLPHRAQWSHPDASPLLLSDDALKLMPAAYIMACGCDVLRDEAHAYAQRLQANGVAVTYRLQESMVHACLNLYNTRFYPKASQRVEPVLREIAQAIREGLGG